eukprot:TRINITY_DN61237_c0_g1_i1.p1 TRINITY_DN61237_c0_g1~~TRINITY_DN61237_c0_g1_i1.p1  ORF type:complete len:678 (-),score=103.32 TRINITY_DN61237_c0_g1_i1:118-2151(-)
MNIVVVGSFGDFDETLGKRQRGPGNGRKHATQAFIRHLGEQIQIHNIIHKVDLLILDWENPPKKNASEIEVELCRGRSFVKRQCIWGSREQLLARFSSCVWDVLICTQAKRLVLDFCAQLKARRHAVMLHDYNIPVGPWGQEQTAAQLSEHKALFDSFAKLCASRHLAEFVGRFGQGEGSFSTCCYAADYDYFDPVPPPLQPWDEAHKYVTMISPCPEKGLCVLKRLAAAMPETPFLAVRTTAWTRPWHEQALKRFSNVKLVAASENLDDVMCVTRVFIVPSLWQEAFGLIVTEAQLRGIPVISTDVCGLAEANRVTSAVVGDLPIVFDSRTRELIVGMTMDEAENSLNPNRAGVLTMEQSRQTAITQESSDRVATEEEADGFVTRLRALLGDGDASLRQASAEARQGACSFVEERRGLFMKTLSHLADTGVEKPAALSLSPQDTCFSPPQRTSRCRDTNDENLDPNFSPDQDFTKVQGFDGRALAARVLVRLCEQGNLSLAAELFQAKADVNASEPEIGVTPLVGAANAGHADVCKYLIRKGADVNLPLCDGTGRTALHAASQMGFVSVVLLLLEKQANPGPLDLTKTTPLHLAVRYGHAGVTELLLKHKANPNQVDDQGSVPINDGVAKDRFDLVTKLLEYGSLVNIRNMSGLEAISYSRTPAMQAIIMKNDVNF